MTDTSSSKFSIPDLAFGTWKLDDQSAARCVAQAIADGYGMVDTAQRYHNEYGVGIGVKNSGLKREDVLVTSKLRGGDQGREQSRRAFFASLRNLGSDYIDVYYVHWPLPRLDLYLESFESMLELREEGFIRQVGVCNFEIPHLQRIISEFGEAPAVNQFELHPGFPQTELVEFCKNNAIEVQGWGVIGRGRGLLEDPTVTALAEQHALTPAQLCIAWANSHGASAVAKSGNRSRWQENLLAAGKELDSETVSQLDVIDLPRMGKDPNVDEEF